MTISLRVDELARELGVESQRVLAVLTDVGMPLPSASSTLSDSQAAAVRSEFERHDDVEGVLTREPDVPIAVAPEPPLGVQASEANLKRLIYQAFQQARQSGRGDWRIMSIAVLKNRLLNLTDRAFRESDYGGRTIRDLVRRLPDFLALDESVHPPSVTLLQNEAPSVLPVVGSDLRVRPDLWRAVIDYRSGKRYLWNGFIAQPAEDIEDGNSREQYPVLPTLTETDMDMWRSEFIEKNASILGGDVGANEQAQLWLTERRGTPYLPGILRGPWNRVLKTRVIERLQAWFKEVGENMPSDLLEPARFSRASTEVSLPTDQLRQLVLRCVHAMTDDELRDLKLPASAVLRAQV